MPTVSVAPRDAPVGRRISPFHCSSMRSGDVEREGTHETRMLVRDQPAFAIPESAASVRPTSHCASRRKSKRNALQPCLDTKPAFPKRFPTGRPVATATQRASQLDHGFPEGCRAHFLWNAIRVRRDQGEHIVFDHFLGRAFRIGTREMAQLQQTNYPPFLSTSHEADNAPRRAKARTIARPILADAPVTTTTSHVLDSILICSFLFREGRD